MPEGIPSVAQEYGWDSAESQETLWERYPEAYSEYWNRPQNKKEYMAELAQNKNVRYAVTGRGSLSIPILRPGRIG